MKNKIVGSRSVGYTFLRENLWRLPKWPDLFDKSRRWVLETAIFIKRANTPSRSNKLNSASDYSASTCSISLISHKDC